VRERLAVTLSVTLGGTAHAIPGGNVRALSLEMSSWGVEGWVEFVVQDDQGRSGKYRDEVLADFQKPDLAEVTISLAPGHLETDTKAADATVQTGGVVLERWLREETHELTLDAGTVLSRIYRLRFADPARALWRQHFPCDLFTKKSFKDVIEAHKGAKATLTYDLDAITTAVPLVFFHLDPDRSASFYDLVMWYVRQNEGVFTFDHVARTYAITKAKDASGTAAVLDAGDLAAMTSIFPAVPRHKPRVLCSYTEAPRTEPGDNDNAAAGVFRDVLLRTPLAKEVDDRVALEKARPLLPGRETELFFRRFPTVKVSPGSLLSISAKGGHAASRLLDVDPWRVHRLSVEARALDTGAEATYGDAGVDLEVSVTAQLEAQAEPAQRLPPFVVPTFPGTLEGKVVSAVGADTDITYDMDQDPDTSVERYKITIPLFANQEIFAPYEPWSGSGTLYLPLYKNERVLIGLDFDRAWVRGLLDWRADVRVPQDGQGQHLFLGKSAKSNTSMLHDYEDDKPVLRFLRTNDKDTVLMRLEEGKLTLKVEETKG
jgi:hypothetical protein